MLVKAFINHYRTVHDDIGSYTVFVVDVYVDGVKHVIERRYSEFEDLHKILKKQMTVPIFPPKKVLNKSSKFIEERRGLLEAYIQEVLSFIQHIDELATFLEIDNCAYENSRLADTIDDYHSGSFSSTQDTEGQLTMCPFLKSTESNDEQLPSREVSPDIVLQGIYQALYAT